MKKLNIKMKILIGLIVLFVIYNIVWFAFVTIKYKPLCDAVGFNEEFNDYSLITDNGEKNGRFLYCVFEPDYLSFHGNLSLCQTQPSDSTEPVIEMMIFPEFSGYRIEVSFCSYHRKEGEVSNEGLGTIVLNEKMEFYDTPTQKDKDFYEEHYEQIKFGFEKMNEVWEIK